MTEWGLRGGECSVAIYTCANVGQDPGVVTWHSRHARARESGTKIHTGRLCFKPWNTNYRSLVLCDYRDWQKECCLETEDSFATEISKLEENKLLCWRQQLISDQLSLSAFTSEGYRACQQWLDRKHRQKVKLLCVVSEHLKTLCKVTQPHDV